MNSPLVSIITATYNRSGVLAWAIRSAIRSTVTDWEMIVVGDHCTDDTGEVVAGFGDPRIRFVNLETNHGEQSVPNNIGLRLAKGRYIAYLNHDDIWLPDHLEQLIDAIEASSADLVFSMLDRVDQDGSRTLTGASTTGAYMPYLAVPATSWLVRPGLVDELGGWRPAHELYNAPSQDFLYRAWKRGYALRHVPVMTGVAIASGCRRGSYISGDDSEHSAVFARTEEPGFREVELERIRRHEAEMGTIRRIRHRLADLIRRMLTALGLHPSAVRHLVVHRRRGGHIAHLRRVRGLEPLVSPGPGKK